MQDKWSLQDALSKPQGITAYAIILHQGSLTRPNNHIDLDQGIVAQRRGLETYNEDESGAEQRPIKVADPSKWFAESFKAQL